MARLGINQYGKAETHLVRVYRDGEVHEIRDLTVSVALSGDMEAVHLALHEHLSIDELDLHSHDDETLRHGRVEG